MRASLQAKRELLHQEHALELLEAVPARPARPLPVLHLNLLDVPAADEAIVEALVYRSKLTRTIHQVSDAPEAKFRCGRVVAASYQRIGAMPKSAYPICKCCFKSCDEPESSK